MDVNLECCPPLTDAALDGDEAQVLAAQLAVLADPVRLRLLSIVGAAPDGEVCACDLPDAVDRSQPTVSHHMKVLATAGFVVREQRGRWAWYRIDPARLALLRGALGG